MACCQASRLRSALHLLLAYYAVAVALPLLLWRSWRYLFLGCDDYGATAVLETLTCVATFRQVIIVEKGWEAYHTQVSLPAIRRFRWLSLESSVYFLTLLLVTHIKRCRQVCRRCALLPFWLSVAIGSVLGGVLSLSLYGPRWQSAWIAIIGSAIGGSVVAVVSEVTMWLRARSLRKQLLMEVAASSAPLQLRLPLGRSFPQARQDTQQLLCDSHSAASDHEAFLPASAQTISLPSQIQDSRQLLDETDVADCSDITNKVASDSFAPPAEASLLTRRRTPASIQSNAIEEAPASLVPPATVLVRQQSYSTRARQSLITRTAVAKPDQSKLTDLETGPDYQISQSTGVESERVEMVEAEVQRTDLEVDRPQSAAIQRAAPQRATSSRGLCALGYGHVLGLGVGIGYGAGDYFRLGWARYVLGVICVDMGLGYGLFWGHALRAVLARVSQATDGSSLGPSDRETTIELAPAQASGWEQGASEREQCHAAVEEETRAVPFQAQVHDRVNAQPAPDGPAIHAYLVRRRSEIEAALSVILSLALTPFLRVAISILSDAGQAISSHDNTSVLASVAVGLVVATCALQLRLAIHFILALRAYHRGITTGQWSEDEQTLYTRVSFLVGRFRSPATRLGWWVARWQLVIWLRQTLLLTKVEVFSRYLDTVEGDRATFNTVLALHVALMLLMLATVWTIQHIVRPFAYASQNAAESWLVISNALLVMLAVPYSLLTQAHTAAWLRIILEVLLALVLCGSAMGAALYLYREQQRLPAQPVSPAATLSGLALTTITRALIEPPVEWDLGMLDVPVSQPEEEPAVCDLMAEDGGDAGGISSEGAVDSPLGSEQYHDPTTGAEVQAPTGSTLGEGAIDVSADVGMLSTIEEAGLAGFLCSAVICVNIAPSTPAPLRVRLPFKSELRPDQLALIRADAAGEWEVVKGCKFDAGYVEASIQQPHPPVACERVVEEIAEEEERPLPSTRGKPSPSPPPSPPSTTLRSPTEIVGAHAAVAILQPGEMLTLPSPPASPPSAVAAGAVLFAVALSVKLFVVDGRSISSAYFSALAKYTGSMLLLNYKLSMKEETPGHGYQVVDSIRLQVMKHSRVIVQPCDSAGAPLHDVEEQALPQWLGDPVETGRLVASPTLIQEASLCRAFVKVKAPRLKDTFKAHLDLSTLQPNEITTAEALRRPEPPHAGLQLRSARGATALDLEAVTSSDSQTSLEAAAPPLPAISMAEDLTYDLDGGEVDEHDLFISYAVEPDASTFQIVRTAFQALGLNVFNPDVDMSRLRVAGGASGELMQQHVRASKIVLAVISRDGAIFKSQWCRMELMAAKEAGIPIIPIYNSDFSALQDIKDHIDGKVEGLGRGTEVYEQLVKYVFKEQIIELVSTQHASEVAQRLAQLADRIRG